MTPAQTSTPMPHFASQQSPIRTMASPAADYSKALEETKLALKELQQDFNVYRKEKQENEKLVLMYLHVYHSI